MAAEPENLVLAIPREMRADIKDVRGDIAHIEETLHEVQRHVASLDKRVGALDEKFELIREGAVFAIGYPARASRAQADWRNKFSALARRVEQREAAK